jgi:hypothetical protein
VKNSTFGKRVASEDVGEKEERVEGRQGARVGEREGELSGAEKKEKKGCNKRRGGFFESPVDRYNRAHIHCGETRI